MALKLEFLSMEEMKASKGNKKLKLRSLGYLAFGHFLRQFCLLILKEQPARGLWDLIPGSSGTLFGPIHSHGSGLPLQDVLHRGCRPRVGRARRRRGAHIGVIRVSEMMDRNVDMRQNWNIKRMISIQILQYIDLH